MKRLVGVLVAALFAACPAAEKVPETVTVAPAAPVEARTATVPPELPECVAGPGVLCPSDEGASDAEFAAFRRQLQEAVAKRDEAALLALTDPNVRTSFGEGGGHDGLRKDLRSSDGALWTELGAILPAGGAFTGEGETRSFWAPYVYAKWPEEVDAFEHVAAIRKDVVLFDTPGPGAKRLAEVPHAILRVVREPNEVPSGPWRHVRAPDGKEGWVRAEDVRSPIGYRAGFSRRSGTWKLEALVAGD